jgi:hypothetical protein
VCQNSGGPQRPGQIERLRDLHHLAAFFKPASRARSVDRNLDTGPQGQVSGENSGHQRGEHLAADGERHWPPVGRISWPPASRRTTARSAGTFEFTHTRVSTGTTARVTC